LKLLNASNSFSSPHFRHFFVCTQDVLVLAQGNLMPRRQPYSEEVKREVMKRLIAPDAPPVLELSKELKISEPTLYAWKKEALGGGGKSKPVAESGSDVRELKARVEKLEAELAEKNRLLLEFSLRLLKQADVLK
jgi:transposase-like protein